MSHIGTTGLLSTAFRREMLAWRNMLWHIFTMSSFDHEITPRIVEALYVEAMLLADETRSHFDPARGDPPGLSPQLLVACSCESLKVTTRLMHCIAWLLNQKALYAGELTPVQVASSRRALGHTPHSDEHLVAQFPEETRKLINSSESLYNRIARLSEHQQGEDSAPPASHLLQQRIAQAF